jgi:hypothetical protein
MIWTPIVAAVVVLTLAGYLLSRPSAADERDNEGEPWNWGDPDCAGYRPDLSQAERETLAAQWRANGRFNL